MAALCGALFASCENMGGDVSPIFVAPVDGGGQGGGSGAAGGSGGSSGGSASATGAVAGTLTASVRLPGLPSLAGIAPVPENVARYAGRSNALAQTNAPAASNDSAQASDGISKSAFPNIADAAATAYTFSATLSQSGTGGATYTADGSYDAVEGKCSFSFGGAKSASEASYTLTVELYHASGTPAVKSLVASGSQSVTVGANAPSFSASVSLAPNLESGAPNGSLNLPIKFSDTSVTSVQLTLLDYGNHDVTASYLDCGTSLTLTGGSGTIASVAGGLPPGTYTLLMTFMKGTAQVGARTESLNVYPAMETSLWWTKDGIGAAMAALSVTQFNQKEFYVRGTGGVFYTTVFPTAAEAEDTNNGSFAFPLKTIQEAVNRIKASGDTTTQYTIYIDGKVTVPADADYSTISDDYKKSLAYIDSAQKIAITGWTGSGFDIIDCGKKCRAITAASGAEVAITKLAIKNGDGVNYGGALYVGGGDSTVVLDDGVLVNGNHCETNGGAIYCNGNLYICGSAVVGDYSPSMTAALEDDCGNLCDGSGGGVSCSGNLYLGYSGKNSSGGLIEKALSGGIYRNYSKTYGGGIYSTGTVTMASGSVDFNAATSGGGVYVSGSSTSSGKFYMGGTSRISGNEATGAGGGVCNSESGIFCMAGSAIVGADPSGLTEAAKVDNGKHSNMAKYGGGIFIGKPSGFKFGYKNEAMSDPTFAGGVYYNYSTDGGGGIRVDCPTGTGQIFNFERGSVCYNSSGLVGGGITVLSVTSNPKIYITGGQVSNNSAGTDGGGIHAQNVYVGGGKIAGNSAAKYGGGVYASQEFYLYGTGVIGDPSKAQIAQANDCSNKAKAGGGVYGHKVYIGYSDASTPAACTGGIYRNYATAVKGSETYFYGGGGICIRGTSAYWLFKMQSGTVAYNAGDSSDGYGGGLFIYGSGAPDSSITYPEATGGSFVGNGAKYGGAVCCYSRTLGLGGSIYMPSATGENGDNDIYLKEGILRLLSNFDSATPTPVVTITPYEYTLNTTVLTGSALTAAECAKFALTQPAGVEFPWTIEYDSTNGGVLKHDRNVFYVADYGDNTSGDGTKDNPYETIKFALTKFTDKMPASVDFKNKIYVLTDMTYDAGLGSDVPCYYEIVGCNGKTVGSNVTLTFNTPDDSGLYVAYGQKIKLTHIDITQSSATVNNYAAILVENSSTNGVGELWMEDCSIKNMYAKSCSAIAAKGDVHLKNVEISGNKTVANTSGATPFGPAINSTTGTVSVLGKVVIKDNQMQINTAAAGDPPSYVYKDQNLWIGENTGTAVFNPIRIAGALDSESDIGVTLFDYGTLYTTFTSGFASAEISAPSDVFTSDDGMSVIKNISGEAIMTAPVSLYVWQTGNDLIGNGSRMAPFATINKAISTINAFDTSGISYTIYVGGTVKGYAEIPDGVKAAKITIDKDPLSLVTNTLDGVGKASPVLTINAAIPVDISNLTITRGSRGVDIEKSATVKITDCVVTGNDATGKTNIAGAGIYVPENSAITPSLTITGGEVSSNTATGLGGGIYFGAGTLTIENVEISGNEATGTNKNGGGLYVGGTGGYVSGFTMTGGSIDGNTSSTDGGGATINCKQSANALLDGVTISGNTASAGNGGGIAITSGKYLSVKDCIIINNTATAGNGGGIYNAGTCYIYGSTAIGEEGASSPAESGASKHSNLAGGNGGGIYSAGTLKLGVNSSGTAVALTGGVYYNFAGIGGGIYNNSGTVTMSSGTIQRNGATNGAGGVYNRAVFNFSDGLIDRNNAPAGAGVYTGGTATFTMSGGTISNNAASATDGSGGGICATGTFSMTGGTISGNSALLGGGIYSSGAASMSGTTATITGNSASYGGGLYVFDNVFTMSGGSITANTATNGGGGVLISSDINSETGAITIGSFAMSGGSISANTASPGGGVLVSSVMDASSVSHDAVFDISDDALIPAGTDGKNDVYLEAPIRLISSLNKDAPVATITPSAYNTAAQVLTQATPGLVGGNYDKFAVTPQTISGGLTKNWTVNSSGYLAQLASGGGTITIHTPEGDLNLAASATTIDTSAADTTVTISATDASGDPITTGFTWNGVTVYYGADEIDIGTGNSYKFKKTFPKGTYTLNVSVTYNGTTYSDSFTIKKTVEGAVAPPAGFVGVEGATVTGGGLTPTSSVFISGRTVAIGNLFVSDHELTQGEYETYCKYGGTDAPSSSHGKGTNYPAYYVSWYDAIVYCNLRSKAEGLTPAYKIGTETDPTKWSGIVSGTGTDAGKYCGPSSDNSTWNGMTFDTTANGYRLPTEAEWEYIARNRNQDSYTYSGSNTIDDVAWYTTNSSSKTHEVKADKIAGTDSANGLGIYDMSGNVWEWCWDYKNTIYTSTSATGPSAASSESYRVHRGGCWGSVASNCSVDNRDSYGPYNRSFGIGFRVVRNAP